MARFAMNWRGAALGATCALALAAPVAAETPTADTVVATVNGADITLGHVIAMRDTLPPQYQSMPDEALFKGITEQLIQQAALGQTMKDKLTKRDTLTLQNTESGYLAGVALQDVVKSAVTDEALKVAYDAAFEPCPTPASDALTPEDITPPAACGLSAEQPEFNASHILVATEEQAKELKAQVDGGADFAELAKEHSSDGAAANGGELGWFGLGMMVKPFEDAVIGMKAGDVAGPIQTQFGWHIVKLNETRTAAAPTLDDMRDELAGQIEQKAVQEYVTRIVGEATVTRPGEGIDPALLRDQNLLGN